MRHYETTPYFTCSCGLTHFFDSPEYESHRGQKVRDGVLVYECLEGDELERVLVEDGEMRGKKEERKKKPSQLKLF